jgi:predicted ATPase
MRINNFQYHDRFHDWRLETTLFSNLTLLVGISGVGKTQILDAIWKVKQIAGGRPSTGVQWNIAFSTNGNEYCWTGEYENKAVPDEELPFWPEHEEGENKPRIVAEELTLNDQMIVQRNDSEILLRGQKTPKLSPFESVLNILSEEEGIAPAHKGFKQIIRSDFSNYRAHMFNPETRDFNKMLKDRVTLDEIQQSSLPSELKVALVHQCAPAVFDKIKEGFVGIFPQVEDIRFEAPKAGRLRPLLFEEYPRLQIKERGVKGWIQEPNISSGMYKTFMHLSEMFLWSVGTVVLIDEFENSLGVNCIDVLTEDLLQENRTLQFIVTSHHPYIINNISFLQLLNLEEYKEGIGV